MENPFEKTGLLFHLLPFLVNLFRYILVAGGFYLVFYTWKKHPWKHRKIQPRFPSPSSLRNEVMFSLRTILIFGAIGYLSVWCRIHGYFPNRFTPLTDPLSVAKLAGSVLVLMLLHDTWFYWTHRWMHLPFVYRWVHKIHHRSTNPSPWASFSFHPLEAIVNALFLPLCLAAFPFHPLALFIFLFLMILMNTIGHLGFEIFPAWFYHSKLGQWQNTSTHHNMHHRYMTSNYGLYFSFWDRIMKSNHPEYETELDKVTGRGWREN